MKAENSTRIQFDSLSSNEAYARGVTAAFLARYVYQTGSKNGACKG